LAARILVLTLYSEIEVRESVIADEALETSSWGMVTIAGAAAGVAFLRARSRQRTHLAWMPQRETMLGFATAAFAVAFILGAIGAMIIGDQLQGKGSTGRWLDGVGEVGLMVAAASASVGFFRSRRATSYG
jgi:hypothetical protein